MTAEKRANEALKNFILVCGNAPEKVVPINSTEKDARDRFKLNTKKELIQFIGNGGLTEITFINEKEWEKNNTIEKPIMVYAFRFRSNYIPGYMAIMYSRVTDKWLIKSFHEPRDDNPTLGDKFIQLGLKR